MVWFFEKVKKKNEIKIDYLWVGGRERGGGGGRERHLPLPGRGRVGGSDR